MEIISSKVSFHDFLCQFAKGTLAALQDLAVRQQAKRSVGTSPNTAWAHMIPDALDATVAFLHLAFCGKGGRPKRTRHCTAMAADAVGGIKEGEVGFGILIETSHRTGIDAGRGIAVHTSDGKILILSCKLALLRLFPKKNTAEGTFMVGN